MTPREVKEQARKHFVTDPDAHRTCYCIEGAVENIIAVERERCAKAVCEGCAAEKDVKDVDGCWMHPHDDGEHLTVCEAQDILQPKEPCKHEWQPANSEFVKRGRMCFRCGAVESWDKPPKDPCDHEWKDVIDPDDEAVTLGQACSKCGALKQKEKTS